MTIGYGVTFALAVCLLIGYLILVKNKEFWLTMMYICVAIVNLGYFMVSMSKTVEFAIFANDVSYFGSVFLSACMFLTIVRLCGFEIRRPQVIACVLGAILMFSIVATAGFLPLYYKSVRLDFVGGSTVMIKEYGVLYFTNLVYLVGYVISMIGTIIYSVKRNKPGSHKFAGLIAGIVCINVAVWLCEKFALWDFELLSITYLISELMLLLVCWMMQDYVHKNDIPTFTAAEEKQLGIDVATMPMSIKINKVLSFVKGGESLAPREREILELILENKKRREIAEGLCLSENTIKTYTRTLYSKLGVSSREELYALLLEGGTEKG